MKEILDEKTPEETAAEEQQKPQPPKKTPIQKWLMISNLIMIPALAFYFYVGLGGRVTGYFLLLILMLVSEYLIMQRYTKNDK